MSNEMTYEEEQLVWEIGPEKFARLGHNRCTQLGSNVAAGYVYGQEGSATSRHDLGMSLCTCVRARIRKAGIVPVRGR